MESISFNNFKIRVKNNKFNGHDVCQIFKKTMNNKESFFGKDKIFEILKKNKLINEELFLFLEKENNKKSFSVLDINNLFFNDSKITVVLDDKNEPWFRAKEIANILEYDNNKMIMKHIDCEDMKFLADFKGALIEPPKNKVEKSGDCGDISKLTYNEQNSIFINESGLYSLILSSKKEEAKKFKRWVTSEVLPSIRKHGEYKLKEEVEIMKQTISKQSQELKTKEEIFSKQLEKEREENKLQLEKEKKEKEDFKEYCNRIQTLEKNEIIYIITNNNDSKNNVFKLGKTKINHLKKRLSTYNTGASDPYFYVYYKEVYNGEQIEKRFYDLMKRYNLKIDNKINKEMYQLYLPDMEFYLEKIIDSNDTLVDLLKTNHEEIFLNSKNKQSVIVPLLTETEEKPIVTITKSFESLTKEEQTKAISDVIKKLDTNVSRKEFENLILQEENLIVHKKMPFWNLIKEVDNDTDFEVTYS